jgi:hypothetical protein
MGYYVLKRGRDIIPPVVVPNPFILGIIGIQSVQQVASVEKEDVFNVTSVQSTLSTTIGVSDPVQDLTGEADDEHAARGVDCSDVYVDGELKSSQDISGDTGE